MAWNSFPRYVPAAEKKRKAAAAAQKLAKKGQTVAPVICEGRKIASTFWGKSWCDNLESYSDFSNRLPRGRTYVRNGAVIDLQISQGQIEALVQGSSLYKVSISIRSLGPSRWQQFKRACSGKLTNLLDLLQGRLSKDILADITASGTGLFPAPKEITLKCSCPDWAEMCKHVAAVLYGIAARLDTQPEMFFTLRGVDMDDLISTASAAAVAPGQAGPATADGLSGADLSDIFGVDIETTAQPPVEALVETPASSGRQTRRAAKKPAKKKTVASSRITKAIAKLRPMATTPKPKKSPRVDK